MLKQNKIVKSCNNDLTPYAGSAVKQSLSQKWTVPYHGKSPWKFGLKIIKIFILSHEGKQEKEKQE